MNVYKYATKNAPHCLDKIQHFYYKDSLTAITYVCIKHYIFYNLNEWTSKDLLDNCSYCKNTCLYKGHP